MNNTTIARGGAEGIEKTLTITVFILTLVLGLIGHGLVILVVIGKIGRRTASDIFILNLSMSDLTFLILSLTVNCHSYTGSFRFSLFYCKFVWPMMTVTFFSSIFTLTCMAVHRCNGVLRPLKANFTARQAMVWAGCIWVMAVVPVLPLMIVTELTESGDNCYEEWSHSSAKAFTVAMFLLQYLIPLGVITVAYIQIVRCLRHRKIPGTLLDNEYGQTLSKSAKRENIQIIKTVAVIVILFAVCMLPHEVLGFMFYFGDYDPVKMHTIMAYSAMLQYIHSCSNPLVYGIITHQFRKEYKRYLLMLICCCRRARFMAYKDSYFRSRSTHKSTLRKPESDTKAPSNGDSNMLLRSQAAKSLDNDGTLAMEDTKM